MPLAKTTTHKPTSETAETAVEVLRQFRQVFNAVKTHFRQVERTVSLGGAQVWALSVVRDQPGIGVGCLAAAMDIHHSTASNLVRGLAARDLLLLEKDPIDRRAVRLKLQPAARKILKAAPGPFAGVLPAALQSLEPATLQRLNKDLAELLTVLEADEQAGRIPLAEM